MAGIDGFVSTGDAATHSLYHGLLEVKCVPFLPKVVSSLSLWFGVQVFSVPLWVACLLEAWSVHALLASLRDLHNLHNLHLPPNEGDAS